MKKVLVLGASGYIGSQLLPQLLDKGYSVTAASRHIDYLESRTSPHPNLTLTYLDLADAESTLSLVDDFDLVFFLVHGMAQGDDFVEYELNLALNFKYALEQSRVKHVIYLSAIQPQTGNSRHLAARKATGKIIRQSGVPVTELRAGVIIGPGSAAFEIMRDFVYNLPILIAPKWVDSKANPIALPNLNHYLLQLAEASPQKKAKFMKLVGQIHSATASSLKSFAESPTSLIGCGRHRYLPPKWHRTGSAWSPLCQQTSAKHYSRG